MKDLGEGWHLTRQQGTTTIAHKHNDQYLLTVLDDDDNAHCPLCKKTVPDGIQGIMLVEGWFK